MDTMLMGLTPNVLYTESSRACNHDSRASPKNKHQSRREYLYEAERKSNKTNIGDLSKNASDLQNRTFKIDVKRVVQHEQTKKCQQISSPKQTSDATREQEEKSSKNHVKQEQQALALINGGKLNEAELIYRELIEAGSKSHTAHGNLGVILKMKGDLINAIMHFKKAIQLNPNFPDAYNNLGVSLQEQGDPNAATPS